MFAWVRTALAENGHKPLLVVKQGEPNRSLMSFDYIQQLPAIQWKLRNIKRINVLTHATAPGRLHEVLDL